MAMFNNQRILSYTFKTCSWCFLKRCQYGLPLRNVMMMDGFWRRDFTMANYSQIYSTLASWQARRGHMAMENHHIDIVFIVYLCVFNGKTHYK